MISDTLAKDNLLGHNLLVYLFHVLHNFSSKTILLNRMYFLLDQIHIFSQAVCSMVICFSSIKWYNINSLATSYLRFVHYWKDRLFLNIRKQDGNVSPLTAYKISSFEPSLHFLETKLCALWILSLCLNLIWSYKASHP